MKLKMYDDVFLNAELENLSGRGVHKSCSGIIIGITGDACLVYFRNYKNRGDYACVFVDSKYLDFDEHQPIKNIAYWKKIVNTEDMSKDCFKPQKFSEYDLVELTAEKEKYAKYGVHKGMRGAVMESYCIDGSYYVIFTDATTAEDIADISVHEDDLVLIRRYKIK